MVAFGGVYRSAYIVARPLAGGLLLAHRGAALDRLRGWVHAVLGTADVELHATHGGPLDGLLEISADADLMVLGRGPHAGIGRLLHGSVGDDLSGLAPCPVAVIPDLPTAARAPV